MLSLSVALALAALATVADAPAPVASPETPALVEVAVAADTLRAVPAEERTIPTYYASEVVVFGDRLAAFRPFAPDPVVVQSLSLKSLSRSEHLAVGDYGTSAYASVRGLPTEHVAIECDGVPLSSLQNGTFDLALLAPIGGAATVARGPFAWLADGRPSQATIAIDSRVRPGVEFTSGGGPGGSLFRIGVGGERWGARLGAVSGDGDRDNTATIGWGAVAEARTPVGDAVVTWLDMAREIPGPVDAPAFSGTERDRAALACVNLRPVGVARPAVYATRQEQRYEDTFASPTHVTSSVGGTVTVPLGSTATGPFGGRRPGRSAVVLSYEWSRLDSSDPLNTDLGIHTRSTAGASIAHVVGAGALRGALRAAAVHTSESATSLSVSLGGSRLWSGGRVWISAGTSERTPTMNELYWPADAWSAGNESLDPERLTTAEAGVEVGDQSRSACVTVYSSKASELIVWTESAHIWRPENVASASLRGIEVDTEARLGVATLAYAADFGVATDDESGLELPYRPGVVQTLSAGVEVGRLSTELRARSADAVYADEANTARLDGYTVLDASASIGLPTPGAALTLEAWNILDEKYALRRGYDMPGRQWRVGLTIGVGP